MKNINTDHVVFAAQRPTYKKQLTVEKPYLFGFSTSMALNFKNAMFRAIKIVSTLKKVIIRELNFSERGMLCTK